MTSPINIGSKNAPAVYKEVTAADSPLGNAITANEYEALQRAFENNTNKGVSLFGAKVGDAQSDFLSAIAGTNKSLARALATHASFFGDDGKPGYMPMRLAEIRDVPPTSSSSGVPTPLAQRIWTLRDRAVADTKDAGTLPGHTTVQYFSSNMARELASDEGQSIVGALKAAGIADPKKAIADVLSGPRPR